MGKTNKNILTLIASGFLFVALIDGLPYGYFTILRFVVCIVGAYIAYNVYKHNPDSLWIWLFAGIAILFNPLIPIYLNREVWVVIDLVVGLIFVLSLFAVRFEPKK